MRISQNNMYALLTVAFTGLLPVAVGAQSPSKNAVLPKSPAQADFQRDIVPLLNKYCIACHSEQKKKGDLSLQAYRDSLSVVRDRSEWQKVLGNIRTREMPPSNKPQPTQAERDFLVAWIETVVFKTDPKRPDPGRVTIRRLNRAEYNNTVRDLVGVDFQPAKDFPADDAGYGFDNIGDVLSVPPVLMEKYLAAAEKILDQAIMSRTYTNGPVAHFDPGKLPSTAEGRTFSKGGRGLDREGEVYLQFKFEKEGDYVFRALAYGEQAGPDPARMELRIDDKAVKVFDVTAVENRPAVYEYRFHAGVGEQKIAAAYINNFRNPDDPNPDRRDRNLVIDHIEIHGPGEALPLPPTHRRIFSRQPVGGDKRGAARVVLGDFAMRAYRRPVSTDEVDRLVTLFDLADKEGETFEGAVKLALQAVLISPNFLFRGEFQPEPDNPKSVHPVNDYSLASRLSYFLWSSMPDDELFREAARGTLRKNLESQVRRMLKDHRAHALVDNFAGQWLMLRNVKLVAPDKKLFPAFDDELRSAMQRETELFFDCIMREDRSILDFLSADYTFVNERLAHHYGLPGRIKGPEFQKVALKGDQRGGVLTHASILTITSNPTRTSPVKRGKWVLENLLGAAPPPPPPDVPDLDGPGRKLTGSLRQRMEQHRENPSCATCHERMDPIGFGLENYDAIGAWRNRDAGVPIDPAGRLATGETFKGASDLSQMLMKKKRDEFVQCLSEKLLTYALGRGTEYYDRPAIEQIARNTAKNRYKFTSLIMEVVRSVPFQMRRGEGDRLAAD
jgi:hypothetical protein